MKKTIILSQNKNQYFFPFVSNSDILFVNPKNKKSLIFKAVRKFILRWNLPLFKFILGNWVEKINEFETIIILDSGYIPGIKNYIKKINSDIDIHLFLWNHVNPTNINMIEDFNDPNKTWSFVNEDCKKLGINYNSTFYSENVPLPQKDIVYDLMFVGRDKGKAKSILRIENLLQKYNLKFKYHLINTNENYSKSIEEKLSNKFLNYDEYLNLISKSRALLDFVESGNTGLSMRVLEALYFNKKLITNNKHIYNERFYNKNNIYIFDRFSEDTVKDILEFIDTPYELVDQSILEYYDIKSWIKRFV